MGKRKRKITLSLLIIIALLVVVYLHFSNVKKVKGCLLISPPSNIGDFSDSINTNDNLGLFLEQDLVSNRKLVIKKPYFNTSYTVDDDSLVTVTFDEKLKQYKICKLIKDNDTFNVNEDLYISSNGKQIYDPIFISKDRNIFYVEEGSQNLYCYNLINKKSRFIAANISKYGLYKSNLIYDKYTDENKTNIFLYSLNSGTETLYKKNYVYLGNSLDGRYISYSSTDARNIIEIEDTKTNIIKKVSGVNNELFTITSISMDGDFMFTCSRTEDNPSYYRLCIYNIENKERKDVLTEYKGLLLPITVYWK